MVTSNLQKQTKVKLVQLILPILFLYYYVYNFPCLSFLYMSSRQLAMLIRLVRENEVVYFLMTKYPLLVCTLRLAMVNAEHSQRKEFCYGNYHSLFRQSKKP